MFQSTYLYKVRPAIIKYSGSTIKFQSTYLYKVRLQGSFTSLGIDKFQSTYLYKVRPYQSTGFRYSYWFQSTYLYKVRLALFILLKITKSFNPRTYIRYDFHDIGHDLRRDGFNPRTYIRYDCITNNANIYSLLSMHLCDNKLFGFFIDEIKLIGVFNRLIINDCENSSFLLMLNVRKQLYYKFIFYIIGCDDTYVFNSFRIIISQEIETNTIFFMIDDIR